MAVVDTILVLDGIQFQKETTSDIYTQDHVINSSVKTVPVIIPIEAKTIRVIFNGAYDPNGGRIHTRIKSLKVTSMSTPTKTAATQEQEWTTLTPPAVAQVAGIDFSASWGGIVVVDMCQSSVTANTTGIELIVQMLIEDSLNEWVTIHKATYLALGAATKSDFAAQEVVAQTTLSVTDPTTGNLQHLGKFVFLEDTVAIEKSEIAFVVECGADS